MRRLGLLGGIALTWLTACGAAPAGALSVASVPQPQPLGACDAQRRQVILRPTADEELASALHARGRPAELASVARAFEQALVECPADADRGHWLERLAALYAQGGDDEAVGHAQRNLACESRYPFAGPRGVPAATELVFRDPYDGCVPAEAGLDAAARLRVFNAWTGIAARHADRASPADAFWAQRAISASRQAAAFATPEQRSLTQLMEARVLYRQARLAAAFRIYASLLEEHERPPEPALDAPERASQARPRLAAEHVDESIAFAASALASVDFEGPDPLAPAPLEPYDHLSEATSRAEMASMLRVTLQRIADPLLLPSDRLWSASVAAQVARLLDDVRLFELASEARAIATRRWP